MRSGSMPTAGRFRPAPAGWRGRWRGRRAWSHVGNWTPAQLTPYAWYDADLGGSALSITDSSTYGRAALDLNFGTNSPTWLDYSLGAGVIPDGSGFNHVRIGSTTPSVTYDGATVQSVEWRVRVRLPSLPASTCYIAGTAGANGALRLTPAGYLLANYTNTSSGNIGNATSTSAITFTANQWIWLRAKVDVYSASAPCDYYWSTDDTDDHAAVSWTSLGTNISTGSNPGYASTGVPTRPTSLGAVIGLAYSLAIVNATLPYGSAVRCVTTLVVPSSGAAAHVRGFGPQHLAQSTAESSVNPITGATHHGTVTIGRATTGRKTVVLGPAASAVRDVVQFGTDDYGQVPAAAIPTMGTTGTATVFAVKRTWATIATGDRIFDTRANTTDVTLGLSMHHDATTADSFNVRAGDGTNTAVSTLTTANRSGVRSCYAALISATEVQAWCDNRYATAVTRPAGTIDTGGVAQIGRNASGTEYSDMQLSAVLTFDRVLTAAELYQLYTYYGGGAT